MLKEYIKIANSHTQITEYAKEQISLGVPDGMFCTALNEPQGNFIQAQCEKVISGKNSNYIVLGRDRNSHLASGAGGAGLTKASAIDLVAGRMSSFINKNDELLTTQNLIGPNFAADAARVYITQKSLNIDDYFALPKSDRGQSPKMKSAVALKADQVRLISREKMVLYCGKGMFEGFSPMDGELNSLGNKISLPPRIEFLTGDPEKLHPLVLGNNLKKYLIQNNKNISDLINQVMKINTQLATINMGLTILSAGAPPFSKFVTDNIKDVVDNITMGLNQITQETNYLDKMVAKGSDSILSDTVFTS